MERNLKSYTKPNERSNVYEGSQVAKLPPQAIDLEEAVLGALMLDQEALPKVIDILKEETFYKRSHQQIFVAICHLFDQQQPVDILTVTEHLRKSGELEMVGGAYYITQLTYKVASSANIEYHARILSQKFIQRSLISISNDIIKDSYEDSMDVLEMLDKAEKSLFSIAENNLRRSFQNIKDLIDETKDQILALKDKPDGLTGVPSGFTGLDRVTSGWQKSDLVIIAARPGMGKTAFVLSAAKNAAVEHNRPVAIFSLEMSAVQLANRLISAQAEIPGGNIRRGKLSTDEWTRLNSKMGDLHEAPIYIDDTPALGIFELRAKCRRLKDQKKIELIVVDYLQLMDGSSGGKQGNREQEIGNISRALKSLAKELEIPVIALSQLNRSVETRGGTKRPQLSDLRESGAIEQDADMVMFIYRPDYYGLSDNEVDYDPRGIAEINIAKHRNGSLENVKLRFIDQYAKFVDHVEDIDNSGAFGDGGIITKGSRMNLDIGLENDPPF